MIRRDGEATGNKSDETSRKATDNKTNRTKNETRCCIENCKQKQTTWRTDPDIDRGEVSINPGAHRQSSAMTEQDEKETALTVPTSNDKKQERQMLHGRKVTDRPTDRPTRNEADNPKAPQVKTQETKDKRGQRLQTKRHHQPAASAQTLRNSAPQKARNDEARRKQ